MLQPGSVLNGKYQITSQIGQGGMSTVYQALDLKTGRTLAIKDAVKDARKPDNTVTEQSLAAEGRVLMGLQSPHLPRIYDIIESADSIKLVMDYVPGMSLDKFLKKFGAQPVDNVLFWGMQVCEVFAYLHSQPRPIIYRDMKPANLILQPNGTIMVIDFGTARTQKFNAQLRSDTINIGTQGFAAPEQYGGLGESDARTDIFCLGATLYNMVTGHSPSEPPKGILPLETWVPALKGTPIQEIIRKCTRNDPNERYQNATELYEDLRLASIGAFKSGSKGRSGTLSGRLSKTAWVDQKFKTETGDDGMSGLLPKKRGWTSFLNRNSKELTPGKTGGTAWQTPEPIPQAPSPEPTPQSPAPPAVNQAQPEKVYFSPPEQTYSQPNPHQDLMQSTQQGLPPQDIPAGEETVAGLTWMQIVIIAAAAGVLMLLMTVLCAALGAVVGAVICLLLMVGAAAAALFGFLKLNR